MSSLGQESYHNALYEKGQSRPAEETEAVWRAEDEPLDPVWVVEDEMHKTTVGQCLSAHALRISKVTDCCIICVRSVTVGDPSS